MPLLIKKSIIFLSLALFVASFSYANSAESTDLVLKCYAKLGKGDEPTGMTLRYSVPEEKVIVNFVNQNNPNNLNHGQCTLNNLTLGKEKMGHFCQFNINDVVYSRNSTSMNLVSVQAPYLIKILKDGGEFSLKVHKDENLCKHGLVVDSVITE